MKVLKFGGTSVGSAERIKKVAALVTSRGRNIIVLSAMSGTTNSLVEIADYLYKKNINGAKETANSLKSKYEETVAELFDTERYRTEAIKEINGCFNYIRSFFKDDFKVFDEREILSQGELMSTALMHCYLCEQGYNSVIIPALDFMRTDSNAEADNQYISNKLWALLEKHSDADLFITQGYVCRNDRGEVDNLQRGGSDLTASIIGAVIEADEIEIWTDIDGMHNNDPRFVNDTEPVDELHFEEAAELAYFGAKILHPTCILPAKLNGIPVRLKNTMQPDAPGTLIYNTRPSKCIKAIAAKDGITAVRIKSGRKLLSYGFIGRVFATFEKYKTPIDMIATSEVGVSVTVDREDNLYNIIEELKEFGTVMVDRDMVIICVVGDLEWHNCGFEASALEALRDIPVRMISYGGSNYNISFLVSHDDKVRALNALSDHLFKNKA